MSNEKNWFARHIKQMKKDVAELETKARKAKRKDAEEMEKIANSLLKKVKGFTDHAMKHSNEFGEFVDDLYKMGGRLERVQKKLEKKKKPWWQRLIDLLKAIFKFLAPVLSIIGSFVPYLLPQPIPLPALPGR